MWDRTGKMSMLPFQSPAYMKAVLTDVYRHPPQSLTLSSPSIPLSLGGETLAAADPVAAAAVAVLGREDDKSPVLVAAYGSMDLTVDPEERCGACMACGTARASDRIGFRTGEFTAAPLILWS
jgi:hypothetical protein